MPSADRSRSGLATAFFSLMALSFGMIGAALMLSAAQSWRRERADFERWRTDLELEGVSNIALARLLVTPGDGPYVGAVLEEGGTYSVRLEREDMKQALAGAGRERPDVGEVLHKATVLAPEDLAQAVFNRLPAGAAECLFRVASPVAGGARSIQPPAAPLAEEGQLAWRSGQRWRIAVTRSDGRSLSRWLLLSGHPGKPGLEIMRARSRVRAGDASACQDEEAQG